METVLGFSLIGFFIFIIFFLVRKFFKKKKVLHEHEQEIILDSVTAYFDLIYKIKKMILI